MSITLNLNESEAVRVRRALYSRRRELNARLDSGTFQDAQAAVYTDAIADLDNVLVKVNAFVPDGRAA